MDTTNTRPITSTPSTKNGTVRPIRQLNAVVRSREYLTEAEVSTLMKSATADDSRRYGHRDATMILLAFRHALRVRELIDLRWPDVDFKAATLHVRRVKGSVSGVHPIDGNELRALRRLRASDASNASSEFVFTTERGGPMAESGFRKMLARLAADAGLGALKVHPHMLRHACGFALVNKGTDTRTLQGYMGHAQISNTVKYTALDANRYRGIWGR